MIELGELEAHHEEFSRRNVQVVVASLENADEAVLTQKQFPHLVIVADSAGKLIAAAQVLHPKAGRSGEDIAAPTTFLIDKHGQVRALLRPSNIAGRYSVAEVLTAIDRELPRGE